MSTNANAASARPRGGDQMIQISDWRPCEKGTLRAFFTVTLPSGLVIRNCMLHKKNEARWISMHAEKWKTGDGWKTIVDFTNHEIRAQFRNRVLEAVDAFLAGAAQ